MHSNCALLGALAGETNDVNDEWNDEIRAAMRDCLLLKPLPEEDFERVAGRSRLYRLAEGERLFERGDPIRQVFLLVSGVIKLYRLASDGDEKVIDIIKPGQTFAEAALFIGSSRYPVSSAAVSPSQVVGFEAEQYLQLLKDNNELCINLLARMSQRLHWMINEVDRLTLHNATFRLVDYLLNQAGDGQSEASEVCLMAPKHVIASRLSMKPETLSRTLKALVNQGLIQVHDNNIELTDVSRLRELVALDA